MPTGGAEVFRSPGRAVWTGYTPEQRRLIRDETMAVVRQKEFV